MKNSAKILRIAFPLAFASGVFVAMLAGVLIFNQVRGKVSMLVNSKQVVRLHDELRSRPKDEALKNQIRQLDFELRQETFTRLHLSRNASWALLGGLAVFLASAHFVRVSRRQLPNPLSWGTTTAAHEKRNAMLARYAVGGAFGMIAATAVAVSTQTVELPERPAANALNAAGSDAAAPSFPSMEEMRKQWPSFRGADGSGVAANATIPVTWDVAAGTNILWQTEVPLPGMSSPVVWGNAVFLTGADETQSCVYRFDLETGALQWSATVKLPGGARPPAPSVMDDTSLAAPTPVTDGLRVYALFPTGEIAAFDMSGKQVWARNIGPLENTYGYASSLAIYQDRLLVQIDRGQPEDGQSRVFALDTQTGQPRWETKRECADGWTSPVIIDIDGQPQLIAAGNPIVAGYNPADGKQLWQNKCLESDVAPSPILAGKMMIVVAPNASIIGLRPGAEEAVWKVEEGVPDATSPVSDGKRVYIVTSSGSLTCLDPETGKAIWTKELDSNFYASPTLVANGLLLVSREGHAWMLEPGDSFKELGKGELGESCCASPAPIDKRLLIRGAKHLFCIGSK